MPNRIIKDSIHTSEKLEKLTDFQFRLWVSLITYVDDYGRGDARPAIIKGTCFPLRDKVSQKDITTALAGLAGAGCIALYEVDGRPYLYFPSWERHQTVRNRKSKFPSPEEGKIAVESTCNQLHAKVPVIQSNPIQSESVSDVCAEPQRDSAPPVINLPLNDGTEYPVSEEQCREWAGLYPAVDVIQQLRQMRAWLNANPAKRKTRRGINAFIVRWLTKEQDRGHGAMGNKQRVRADSAAAYKAAHDTPEAHAEAAKDLANMRKLYEQMGGRKNG